MKPHTFGLMPRLTRLATLSTLISGVLLVGGISFAIVSFNQNRALLPYSCWNHAISELGFPFASALTWLFNGALMIGGLMFLPTHYVMGAHLRTRLGYAATTFGYLGGLALSSLGLVGLRQDVLHAPYSFGPFFAIHVVLALVFFLACTVGILLFTIQFYRRREDPSVRPLILAGMACGLVYITFMVVSICPNPTHAALAKEFRVIVNLPPTSSPLLSHWLDSHRPPILWPAALEWMWAGVVLLWHGIALLFLWIKTREASDHSKTRERCFSDEVGT